MNKIYTKHAERIVDSINKHKLTKLQADELIATIAIQENLRIKKLYATIKNINY